MAVPASRGGNGRRVAENDHDAGLFLVELPLPWTEPGRPGIRNVTAPGGLVLPPVDEREGRGDVRPVQRDHDYARADHGEHGPPNRALSGIVDEVMLVPLPERRPVAPGQDRLKDAGRRARILDGNGNGKIETVR
jgi:hypothetical protein